MSCKCAIKLEEEKYTVMDFSYKTFQYKKKNPANISAMCIETTVRITQSENNKTQYNMFSTTKAP